MSYLERLRNFKNTLPPVPTEPTKPGSVGFVGSSPSTFQKKHFEKRAVVGDQNEFRREFAELRQLQQTARESMASGLEAPQAGAAVTLTNGQAALACTRTPSGPIPWHDATPDDRAEIKTALFEGLPVQIYSKVLGEIVWWALDDDVARKLKDGEFVEQGYPPYQGEAIYVWSELLAVLGFPPDALKNLHEFKKAFDARISKPRVICSGCRNLAATHHHCVMRKDIRIANPDNPIECDLYMTR